MRHEYFDFIASVAACRGFCPPWHNLRRAIAAKAAYITAEDAMGRSGPAGHLAGQHGRPHAAA